MQAPRSKLRRNIQPARDDFLRASISASETNTVATSGKATEGQTLAPVSVNLRRAYQSQAAMAASPRRSDAAPLLRADARSPACETFVNLIFREAVLRG